MIILLNIIIIIRELWALTHFNNYYYIIQKGTINKIATSIQDKINLKTTNIDKTIDIKTDIKNFISYLILSLIDIFYAILCIIFITKGFPFVYIGTIILTFTAMSYTPIGENKFFTFIDTTICFILLVYSYLLQAGLIKCISYYFY